MDNVNKTGALIINRSLTFYLYILVTIFSTLLLAHNQIIVGTIVNSLLFFTALNIEKRYYLPIAIFPSILAVFQGLLFGSFTIFLVYFLPFIWAGNYVLMLLSNKLKNNYLLALPGSAILKFVFLFITAYIFVNFHFVPKIFLTSMGIFQLFTAVLGGILFIIVNKLVNAK